MKRTYAKPSMTVERFMANMSVADCSKIEEDQIEQYGAQTVSCVITSQDTIFTANTTGCVHQVDLSHNGTDYYFNTYNGTLYFCWRSSNVGRSPTEDEMTLLRAVTGNEDPQGWHAGPCTSNLITIYSHS